jgi:hypothetical protein
VLVIPDIKDNYSLNELSFERKYPRGIKPELLTLSSLHHKDKQELEANLNEHKSLGIQVKLAEPEYVGVKVIAEVFLAEKYRKPEKQAEIRNKILNKIYYFLNPITGGYENKGWLIGDYLKAAEIIGILQKMPEIEYVGNVQLFSIRKHPVETEWQCSEFPEFLIELNESELLCSWSDADENSDINSQIIFLT